jgi:dipeptidyl aminopeptidase/acylaminoacyl peptidase
VNWIRTRFTLVPLVALSALAAAPSAAQAPSEPDSPLIAQSPCPPFEAPSYEQYANAAKQDHAEALEAARREGMVMRSRLSLATRDAFDRDIAKSRSIDCTSIVYLSDGLKVKGLIWRPKDQGARPLPLIIFNRGGNREFARVKPWHAFHRLASDGFVVMASQYRGVDGGEGQEEYGGADVHDILNLVPVARSVGYVDLNNMFMLGWSRGGMMTFLAVAQGMKVNAIAVGSALLDLVAEAKRRPALARNVWSQLMPGFATRTEEVLRERSPMYWPERIDVPALIMHGGADWRASADETLAFAQKLQQAGKTYELIIYADDDHALSGNQADSNQRIVSWFRKHMK